MENEYKVKCSEHADLCRAYSLFMQMNMYINLNLYDNK